MTKEEPEVLETQEAYTTEDDPKSAELQMRRTRSSSSSSRSGGRGRDRHAGRREHGTGRGEGGRGRVRRRSSGSRTTDYEAQIENFQLHDEAVDIETIHVGPFDDIKKTWREGDACDCYTYGVEGCVQQWVTPESPFNFNEQRAIARRTANASHRRPNNVMRHSLYSKLYKNFNYGSDYYGGRVELPICVTALARSIYPSRSGWYQGYQEA